MVVITDTHFDRNNIQQVRFVISKVIEYCKSNNQNIVVHQGDWFTSRTGQTLSVLMAMLDVVAEFKKNKISVITIPGNHDKTDLEDERSYLDIFNSEGFRVISSETICSLEYKLHAFLPYFPENGTYPERLNILSNNVKKQSSGKVILHTHIGVHGANNNIGGVDLNNSLKRELFKSFDEVLIGHYHNRNTPWPHCQYIGSLLPRNFGEDNEKGITVIDFKGVVKFIKLDCFKHYFQFDLDLSNMTEASLEAILECEEMAKSHNIKINIIGSEEELNSFDEKIFSQMGIVVERKDRRILRSIHDIEEYVSMSFDLNQIHSAFSEYCKINEIERNKYLTAKPFIDKLIEQNVSSS